MTHGYLKIKVNNLFLTESITPQDNWIIRPYVAFESKLESSLQHPLPQFELPADLEHTQFPLPYVVFRIFDTPVRGPRKIVF